MKIKSTDLLRVFGIVLVVLNHALSHSHDKRIFLPHGGMNILMMITGITLGNAFINKTTQDIHRLSFIFIKKLIFPAILLAVVTQVYSKEFKASEIMLVSNLFDRDRVAKFPIWYVEVLLQIVIFLNIFFMINFNRSIRTENIKIKYYSFHAISLISFIIAKFFFGSSLQLGNLPFFFLPEFSLGLLLSAWGNSPNKMWGKTLYIISFCYFIFGIFGDDHRLSRIIFFLPACCLILYKYKVTISRRIYFIIAVMSKETFSIFLLHYYVFGLIFKIEKAFFGTDQKSADLYVLLPMFGLTIPILVSILLRSARQTFLVWKKVNIGGRTQKYFHSNK